MSDETVETEGAADQLQPGQIADFERLVNATGNASLIQTWLPLRRVITKQEKRLRRLQSQVSADGSHTEADLQAAQLKGRAAMEQFVEELSLKDLKSFKSAAMARGDASFMKFILESAERLQERQEGGAMLIFIEPHPDEQKPAPDEGTAVPAL